jgi:Zn-dependent peptidase ImmA (M78 family)
MCEMKSLELDMNGIESKVDEFRVKYKVPSPRECTHIELANIINAEIITENLLNTDLTQANGISTTSDSPNIYLPDVGYDENEKRFSVAHEIGHFFLHMRPDMVAPQFGKGDVENEASSFAGALLMPRDDVAEAYKALRSVAMVASYFRVPVESAQTRLESLNIVS